MPLELVTSEQIKAARIFLHMSAQDLADSAGVGIATIKRIEAVDGVPQANIRTLQLIVKALENAGIEFIGSALGSCGVRLKSK